MRVGAFLLGLVTMALAGCAAVVPRSAGPQDQFYARIRALCGQAFEGRVVSRDEADREMAASRLVLQVRQCTGGAISMPFHVGNDHSRVFVLTRTAAGLHLAHDHHAESGAEGSPTGYGGDTIAAGNSRRQEFPADAHSRDLFVRADLPGSIPNIWAMEIVPGQLFAYELRRPGRFLRVEFDLTRPAPAPPPPWGER